MYDEDDEEEAEGEALVVVPALPPPVNALAYLQSIYRNPFEAEGRRLKAAVAALPFESPKLLAQTLLTNEDFMTLLDRAIERSNGARLINHHESDGD